MWSLFCMCFDVAYDLKWVRSYIWNILLILCSTDFLISFLIILYVFCTQNNFVWCKQYPSIYIIVRPRRTSRQWLNLWSLSRKLGYSGIGQGVEMGFYRYTYFLPLQLSSYTYNEISACLDTIFRIFMQNERSKIIYH